MRSIHNRLSKTYAVYHVFNEPPATPVGEQPSPTFFARGEKRGPPPPEARREGLEAGGSFKKNKRNKVRHMVFNTRVTQKMRSIHNRLCPCCNGRPKPMLSLTCLTNLRLRPWASSPPLLFSPLAKKEARLPRRPGGRAWRPDPEGGLGGPTRREGLEAGGSFRKIKETKLNTWY